MIQQISGMAGLSHDEKSNRLFLCSLNFRRMRGDDVEMHKFLRGLDRINKGKMLPLPEIYRTSGSLKISYRPFSTVSKLISSLNFNNNQNSQSVHSYVQKFKIYFNFICFDGQLNKEHLHYVILHIFLIMPNDL